MVYNNREKLNEEIVEYTEQIRKVLRDIFGENLAQASAAVLSYLDGELSSIQNEIYDKDLEEVVLSRLFTKVERLKLKVKVLLFDRSDQFTTKFNEFSSKLELLQLKIEVRRMATVLSQKDFDELVRATDKKLLNIKNKGLEEKKQIFSSIYEEALSKLRSN